MSATGAVVSLGAAIISTFFTATVLFLFLEKRKPQHVAWTLGLGMFTVVALVQFFAEIFAWTDALFRAWYALGAGGLVGLLGLGSVYLVHRRMGHAFAVYVVAVFALFVAAIATAPTDPAAIASFSAGVPVSGAGWDSGALPRILSPLLNVPGGLALIGLALYGFVRFRLRYNGYIAVGAIVQALGTGLSRFRETFLQFGLDTAALIYAAEFVGIVLLFVGFRAAIEWSRERAKSGEGAPPEKPEEDQAPAVQTAAK